MFAARKSLLFFSWACRFACVLTGLGLAGCDSAPGASPIADGGSDAASDAGAALCTAGPNEGTVCSGGENAPGLTAQSVNNQGLIGDSVNGRGVYGSSIASEGGYFSSTDGDGLLAYSTNGYSAHFTGGRGVIIDPPGPTAVAALSINGSERVALPAAATSAVPVCGTLDQASGLFTLGSCVDRFAALEARIAALEARLGTADAGAP
jgi:hypothetical protein